MQFSTLTTFAILAFISPIAGQITTVGTACSSALAALPTCAELCIDAFPVICDPNDIACLCTNDLPLIGSPTPSACFASACGTDGAVSATAAASAVCSACS